MEQQFNINLSFHVYPLIIFSLSTLCSKNLRDHDAAKCGALALCYAIFTSVSSYDSNP